MILAVLDARCGVSLAGNDVYLNVAGGLRNPAAAPKMFGNVLLGFALTEAVALYALVMAVLIMFG